MLSVEIRRSLAPNHYLVLDRPSVELRSISHLENILAYFYHRLIDFSMSSSPCCVREVFSCTAHWGDAA